MATDKQPHAIRVERQLRTLEGLLAIETIELMPSLDQAALLVADVLGTDKIDIFFHQPESRTLVALGVSPTPMGRREVAIGLDRQPIANHGRAAEVFLTGQPYLNGHVDRDAGELAGIREGLGIQSEMIVPLVVAGERRGVLVVSSAIPEAFSEEDLEFLYAVARWVGLVAYRAELTQHVARRAEERGRRAALAEIVGRLTTRELEVAALLVQGVTNAEIARKLIITQGTAANHVRSILLKLEAPSRARVAAIMARLGIEAPDHA